MFILGQLFIWDVVAGVEIKSFKNTIEGQGYGALFDAKWSPDGLSIAATDSHGHILIFGIGSDSLFKKVYLAQSYYLFFIYLLLLIIFWGDKAT